MRGPSPRLNNRLDLHVGERSRRFARMDARRRNHGDIQVTRFVKLKRSRVRRSKKALSRAKMILELDADARRRVFQRDEVCQRCHVHERAIQWAHMITRRNLSLRWEVDNALALCGGCHLWFDGNPLLSADWFQKNWPERHANIMRVFQLNLQVKDCDIRAKLEELRAR